MWYIYGFYLLLALIVLAVLIAGQLPELIGAAMFLTAAVGSQLIVGDRGWLSPEWGELAVDLVLIGGLLWIGRTYQRWWPAVAAGFVFVSAIAAIGRWIDPTFGQVAYAMMASFSSYPTLVVLSVAFLRHRRLPFSSLRINSTLKPTR